MPRYRYKARSIDAKPCVGEIEAYDANDALNKLTEQRLFISDISEVNDKKLYRPLKSKQLAEFCKELSLMLSSGLPMVKALNIIANGETSHKRIKEIYLRLHRSLRNGMALSDAMREQGGVFPELLVNMISSGEISGTMVNVAEKMADYYQADHKLKAKINQATTYPKILATLTLGAIIVLFIFVLPKILNMLGDQPLPAITQFMKSISDTLIYKWYNVLIAASIIAAVFIYVRSLKTVKLFWHRMLLRIPRVGKLLKIIYTARFARTLSSLYSSGVALVTAIGVSSKIIGNLYVEGQFPDIVRRVKQGEPLSEVISKTNGFSPKIQSIMVIGEETGKLDDILNFAATSFEYDSDVAITSLISLLEPVMLVIMAGVIGSVVVSVLLPILTMYQTVGGGM